VCSCLGRFTSVDPLTASATIRNPQTLNRYAYVLNSPYKYVDPLGLIPQGAGAVGGCGTEFASCEGSSDGLSDDVREFNQQYEDRLRDNWDRNRAQAAANHGDWDTFWDIMRGNDTLSAYDQNGVRVRGPNEPTVTVTATVYSPQDDPPELEELKSQQNIESFNLRLEFNTWVASAFGIGSVTASGIVVTEPVANLVPGIQSAVSFLFDRVWSLAVRGKLTNSEMEKLISQFAVNVGIFGGPSNKFKGKLKGVPVRRYFGRNELVQFGSKFGRLIAITARQLGFDHWHQRVELKHRLIRRGQYSTE